MLVNGHEVRPNSMLVPFQVDSRTAIPLIEVPVLEIQLPSDSQASILLLHTIPTLTHITLKFLGTSASVYGIFSWANLGVLSATFTLDGDALSQSYSVTTSTPSHVNNDGEAVNFLLFSSDNLSAGDHTLVMNITRCDNQAFIFDYITYTPSFSSLSTMPSPSTSVSPTAPTGIRNTSSDRNSPTGAIVGGILGGLLLIALIAILLLSQRRRQRSNRFTYFDLGGKDTTIISPENQMLDSLSPSPGSITPFQSMEPPAHYGYMHDLKQERANASDLQRTIDDIPLATTSASSSNIHDNPATGGRTSVDAIASGPPAYDAISTRLDDQETSTLLGQHRLPR